MSKIHPEDSSSILPFNNWRDVGGKSNGRINQGGELEVASVAGSGYGELAKSGVSMSARVPSFLAGSSGRFSRRGARSRLIYMDSREWIWWFYITTMLAMTSGFIEPLRVAFISPPGLAPYNDFWAIQDYIITTVFFVDMGLRFFLVSVNKETGIVATSRKETATNYLKGMFIWDLFFTFPWDWVIMGALGDMNSISNEALEVSLLKLIKMGRLYRVFQLFHHLYHKMVISEILLMLIRNWTYVLFSCHWAACIFYLIARLEHFDEESWVGRAWARFEGQSTLVRYIYSLYVSVSAFVGSLGDNDFYSATVFESAFMIFYCLLNVVLTAYVLGTVTMLMVKTDEKNKDLRDKKTNLREFQRTRNIPETLFKTMEEHLELHHFSEETADENILGVYPEYLRRRVLRNLYESKVKACYLFKGCSTRFIDAVLAGSRIELHLPDVEVLKNGDIVSELYIIMEGEVNVTVGEKKSGTKSMDGGDRSQRGGGSMGGGASSRSFTGGDVSMSGNSSVNGSVFGVRGSGAITSRTDSEPFGEVAFFTEAMGGETIWTTSVTRVLVLPKTKYEVLQATFPNQIRRVVQNLQKQSDLIFETEVNIIEEEEGLGMDFFKNAKDEEKTNEEILELLGERIDPDTRLKLENLLSVKTAISNTFTQMELARVSKFLNYVCAGATAEIQGMLKQHYNPDQGDYDGRNGLLVACASGQAEVAKLLLDSGANPMVRDKFDRTPIMEAAMHGHDDIMKLLRAHKATLDGEGHITSGLMSSAVYEGDLKLLRRLLEGGASPDAHDYDLRRPLHVAAAEGNVTAVKMLVEVGGASLDVEDRWGNTPLMEAQRSGAKLVIDYIEPLIKAAAPVRLQMIKQQRVNKLLSAASSCNLEEVSSMLREGVEVDASDKAFLGRTALMLAAEAGDENVVLKLLQSDPDSKIVDFHGYSTMYYAVMSGNDHIVDLLRERNFKMSMNEEKVAQVLIECILAKNLPRLEEFLYAGARANSLMPGRVSPLHVAASQNSREAVKLLVELGKADIMVRNQSGLTPYDEAVNAEAKSVVDYFRSLLPADALRGQKVPIHDHLQSMSGSIQLPGETFKKPTMSSSPMAGMAPTAQDPVLLLDSIDDTAQRMVDATSVDDSVSSATGLKQMPRAVASTVGAPATATANERTLSPSHQAPGRLGSSAQRNVIEGEGDVRSQQWPPLGIAPFPSSADFQSIVAEEMMNLDLNGELEQSKASLVGKNGKPSSRSQAVLEDAVGGPTTSGNSGPSTPAAATSGVGGLGSPAVKDDDDDDLDKLLEGFQAMPTGRRGEMDFKG